MESSSRPNSSFSFVSLQSKIWTEPISGLVVFRDVDVPSEEEGYAGSDESQNKQVPEWDARNNLSRHNDAFQILSGERNNVHQENTSQFKVHTCFV